MSEKGAGTAWVLDSGCTYHMTPNKTWFESFKTEEGGRVLLGNSKACKVLGQGTMRLKVYNGQEFLLTRVGYVPELKKSLISLGILDQLVYNFKASGVVTVFRGNQVWLVGHKTNDNGLYMFSGSTTISLELHVSDYVMDKTSLWHLRLGHVSDLALKKLSQMGWSRFCF